MPALVLRNAPDTSACKVCWKKHEREREPAEGRLTDITTPTSSTLLPAEPWYRTSRPVAPCSEGGECWSWDSRDEIRPMRRRGPSTCSFHRGLEIANRRCSCEDCHAGCWTGVGRVWQVARELGVDRSRWGERCLAAVGGRQQCLTAAQTEPSAKIAGWPGACRG